ncbi:MAG: glutamine amidotransferase [Flavobacteriaceae bacterium]
MTAASVQDERAAPADARPVLIVLHQEHSTPGRIGQALERRGLALDIRRPPLGDPLPETMENHRGAIIFGGPMSANDAEDHIRRETEWIAVPLKEDRPFLGVCLGAQMLANHLGGSVRPHPQGHAEIGYYPLRPTPAGEKLMRWPGTVYQWHREGFATPPCAELLAEGDLFREQAFRYGGKAYGVQFHCELTLAMLHRWTVRAAHRLELPSAQPRRAHFAGRAVHDTEIRAWMEDFLDLWLALDGPA